MFFIRNHRRLYNFGTWLSPKNRSISVKTRNPLEGNSALSLGSERKNVPLLVGAYARLLHASPKAIERKGTSKFLEPAAPRSINGRVSIGSSMLAHYFQLCCLRRHVLAFPHTCARLRRRPPQILLKSCCPNSATNRRRVTAGPGFGGAARRGHKSRDVRSSAARAPLPWPLPPSSCQRSNAA